MAPILLALCLLGVRVSSAAAQTITATTGAVNGIVSDKYQGHYSRRDRIVTVLNQGTKIRVLLPITRTAGDGDLPAAIGASVW